MDLQVFPLRSETWKHPTNSLATCATGPQLLRDSNHRWRPQMMLQPVSPSCGSVFLSWRRRLARCAPASRRIKQSSRARSNVSVAVGILARAICLACANEHSPAARRSASRPKQRRRVACRERRRRLAEAHAHPLERRALLLARPGEVAARPVGQRSRSVSSVPSSPAPDAVSAGSELVANRPG